MRSRTRDVVVPCSALIADLHILAQTTTGEAALVAGVATRLASAGAERRWLIDSYRKAEPKKYRQSLVYVAADRSFSVVALTWGPGAQTSIHDHAGWCAVAVYEGVEYEKQYRICA